MTALKLSQLKTHSPQLRFIPTSQRIKQTSALAEREKQKIQLSHSLAEPRPAGIASRRRSKTANGPRSFVKRWLSLKVANDPRMKENQRIASVQKYRNQFFRSKRYSWRITKSSITVRAEDFLLCYLARRF